MPHADIVFGHDIMLVYGYRMFDPGRQ